MCRFHAVVRLTLFVIASLTGVANSHAHGTHSPISTVNDCGLLDYFQYIYRTPTRPHNCTNVPAEFYDYQRDVGEAASSGSSSGGSAAGSSAGAASAGAGTSSPTSIGHTIPSSLSAEHVLGYTPKAKEEASVQAMDDLQTYEDDWSDLPPLERSFFFRPTGSFGSKNATATDASVKVEAVGAVAGIDLISNSYVRLGLLGSINKVDVDVNENITSIDIFIPKVGLTGTFEWRNWYLDGMAQYGPEYYETSRYIDIDGNGDLRRMSSKYTNHRITGAFEAGRRITLGSIVAQPHVGIQYNGMRQARVVEDGNADAAIHTARKDVFTGTTKVGLNLSTVWFWGRAPIVPVIGIGWTHRFGDLDRASRISVDSGATFENVGSAPSKDLLNLQAALSANINKNLFLNIGGSALFNGVERTYTGSAGFRLRF
ncbi:autotransporter outer membrane beta-barrel domain-containing protein [Cohaesibacter gelatinilyticus]|uniref:Autotransporter beta-domain-containing protein n=1 Tax=Cohaesibacter gelatinilyticus TaxID=372072 RepID=A0A285NHY7_9HYPH|nr:autotransporter outer membrane beta-barrel domain-containing protein [Cohaesibacter gelatinilyticus]SNZ07271.1 Autotransporter beta-domain-containing protein [Cohaesibacter gelatinilyticus]